VTVPILYYHYIRVNPNARDQAGFKLSVTPGNFTQQMALLRDEGTHTITMDTLMAALQGGLPLPSRSVVLTFDDGHDDFATQAAAVLIADGLTATSFVVPGFLGRNSYMTSNQVQAVAAEGFTIGAHTMHHVDLVAQPASIANLEIMESRQVLRQLTGQPVLDFAYPYGALDGAVQSMVDAAGFRDAVSTYYGFTQCLGQRFALRRVEVTGYDSLQACARKATVPYRVPRAVTASPRTSGPTGSAGP